MFYNGGQKKMTAWHVAHSHLFEQIIWHINGCKKKKRKEKRASKTIHSEKNILPLAKNSLLHKSKYYTIEQVRKNA